MDVKDIKELINIVAESNLSEFNFEEGNIKISLKKEELKVGNVVAVETVEVPKETVAPAASNSATAETSVNENDVVITSPLVGTVYLNNEETGEPFVQVGTKVKKGQVLAIVEAMKMMNEIESSVDGTVVKVLADDKSTVEYGGEMFVICQDI